MSPSEPVERRSHNHRSGRVGAEERSDHRVGLCPCLPGNRDRSSAPTLKGREIFSDMSCDGHEYGDWQLEG